MTFIAPPTGNSGSLCVYMVFHAVLSGPCSHTVQKLKLQEITSITVKTLKVVPDRIIDNYNKRQQPRFRLVSQCVKMDIN